ncbi:hypothetical protein CERZMDRAFT_120565 [Cercospora zeae-maydis SCOH1-5]|uniref:Uncharacterized protein n=1 Tax=Cercospora zeae-maydis SCOH1-5 TaxID=717836 RepID=A0A6A6FLL6_9PEZI|nr:hypothetical protein CERZMDRAFT_120565 [Cercospora zeae-maydis SCOH1-5]
MAFKSFALASALLLSLVSAAPQGDGSCTLCVDKVNDCGNMYGGCYNYCTEPQKEFLVPACDGLGAFNETCYYGPANKGSPFAGQCYASNTTAPPSGPDADCTVCVDRVNDCGQKYGECRNFCKNGQFELSVPDCNGVSGQKVICTFKKNKEGLTIGGCIPAPTPPSPSGQNCRICVDRANDCGKMYGGCYNFCNEPSKTFDVPECNGVKKTEVCEYATNECGKVYGGCYPSGGPVPPFEAPSCP